MDGWSLVITFGLIMLLHFSFEVQSGTRSIAIGGLGGGRGTVMGAAE